MHHFTYQNNELYCEDVAIKEIAEKVGTPFYVYSHATLTRHFTAFDKAFSDIPHKICFSAKANSSLAILKLFASMGGGLDIVSGGELYRGLNAGIPADNIVYSGVGKTTAEIDYALKSGILMFNVESYDELLAINSRARQLDVRAPISLRVNPDVDPQTHPYISTGLKKNKFGIDKLKAVDVYKEASELSHVDIVGIDFHIGSQITQLGPFVEAVQSVRALADELKSLGIVIRYLDVGGGLGIPYDDEEPPLPQAYADAISQVLAGADIELVMEPGRAIVGNAGVLVTRIVYMKAGSTKDFAIVDAGMNDLMRPSLYNAFHAIQPVEKKEGESVTADVVGPICETGDFLGKDREIGAVDGGDLLAVMSSGAYGFSMSSNYNSRPRVAEVMVSGKSFAVIRERETYEDLVKGESIPSFL